MRGAAPSALEALYAETEHWRVNAGDETIHAKRISGRWRRRKWLAASVWLIFFLGPYVPWAGRQAVLFDIPQRQYHLFGITVLPQDFWLLALLLLFFAVLLALATVLAGRVYCGYFCFQTVWTDVFTAIEDWLEGPPQQRRRLAQAPLSWPKLKVRLIKHTLWLVISWATGFSFVAWFYGAGPLWRDFFLGQANGAVYAFVALFTAGTYLLAGWLREQTCLWLCPYARIQGALLDRATVVPSYDAARGEPRARLHRGERAPGAGDCISCNLCVAVCPTGVDIRAGLQEGCITCGLCIDACDAVMDKIGRPRGLVRYASLDALEGRPVKPWWQRLRVWLYGSILVWSVAGIGYGLSRVAAIEINVLHERAPLFVVLRDGAIQNKYTVKLLNKTAHELTATLAVSAAVPLTVSGAEMPIMLRPGATTPVVVFVRLPQTAVPNGTRSLTFRVAAQLPTGTVVTVERPSAFFAPTDLTP